MNRPPGRNSLATSGTEVVGVDKAVCAVVGNNKVEASVGKRSGIGASQHQWEVDPIRSRARSELLLGHIEPRHTSATVCQRLSELPGAATQLEHVEPGYVGEDAKLSFGELPHPPVCLGVRDQLGVSPLVLLRFRVPVRPVSRDVRRARRGTTARSRARPTPGRSEPCTEIVRHREREARHAGEPGSASTRVSVAPIVFAAVRDPAPRPRSTNASVGPEVIEEWYELAEERLLTVLGVVGRAKLSATPTTSFAARTFSPRRSKRARNSPARLRATASGLAWIRVCCVAMRRAA